MSWTKRPSLICLSSSGEDGDVAMRFVRVDTPKLARELVEGLRRTFQERHAGQGGQSAFTGEGRARLSIVPAADGPKVTR